MMELINIGTKSVEIYPNPFSSYTIITIPENLLKPCSLELFDLSGEKVYSYTNIISNKFILGRGQLKKGSYFYKVFNPDFSFLSTGKIIVN
ncbi:MAG: T9SS type A sorting domain-containing protein [Bacteroidales bacterium]|nr:T9SS type A sorting domain-containing protein [Bacteroidales bacterium]